MQHIILILFILAGQDGTPGGSSETGDVAEASHAEASHIVLRSESLDLDRSLEAEDTHMQTGSWAARERGSEVVVQCCIELRQ